MARIHTRRTRTTTNMDDEEQANTSLNAKEDNPLPAPTNSTVNTVEHPHQHNTDEYEEHTNTTLHSMAVSIFHAALLVDYSSDSPYIQRVFHRDYFFCETMN